MKIKSCSWLGALFLLLGCGPLHATTNATVLLTNLFPIYDGTAKSATVITVPPNLANTVTYNGSADLPTNAGIYPVIATVTDSNYTGTVSNTLEIQQLRVRIVLGDLVQPYDGTGKSVSISTVPPGYESQVVFAETNTLPTNAGVYPLTATLADPGAYNNYQGSTNDVLEIKPTLAGNLILTNLTQTYDGTPKPVTTVTTPSGLAAVVSYNGLPPESWSSLPNFPLTDGIFAGGISLADGRVLILANTLSDHSIQSMIYDPTSKAWSYTSPTQTPRPPGVLIALSNGKVLLEGGQDDQGNVLTNAQLFDPITLTWSATGSMPASFVYNLGVGLTNGKALLTGISAEGIAGCELYDSASGTWAAAAVPDQFSMPPQLTLLPDGRVLATGASTNVPAAQLYDPGTDTWSPTGAPLFLDIGVSPVVLANGKVLLIGGNINQIAGELYDPVTESWSPTGPLAGNYSAFNLVRLTDGRVLMAGGSVNYFKGLANCSIYDPATETWALTGSLISQRMFPSVFALPQGQVLLAGGLQRTNDDEGILEDISVTDVELFNPRALSAPVNAGAYPIIGHVTELNYDRSDVTNTLTIQRAPVTLTLGDLSQNYDGSVKNASVTTTPPGVPVELTYNGTVAGDDSWHAINPMTSSRSAHTATLLADGRVLVAGGISSQINNPAIAGAEYFDLTTGAWTPAANMTAARAQHTATLLSNGKVLVAGGTSISNNSAELFDPVTGLWTVTGPLKINRSQHSAVLLSNGNVLVEGGFSSNSDLLDNPELYDPATGSWTALSVANNGRVFLSLALLSNGRALVSGGGNLIDGILASALLFDSDTGTWTPTGSMTHGRFSHSVSLLANGNMLAAGGSDESFNPVATAEVYNYLAGTWATVAPMSSPRSAHTAVTLHNGKVLVAGGGDASSNPLGTSELYQSTNQAWAPPVSMTTARNGHTMTLLADGSALVTGGGLNGGVLASAERYVPGGGVIASGNYTVVATVIDLNHIGTITGTLIIHSTLSNAVVTLSNLTNTYDGTAKSVSVTTVPAGLAVSVTYEGSTSAPTNRGSYTVVATVVDPAYEGSATGIMTIDLPPPATVILSNLTQTYDGTAKSASVTTVPPGLAVNVTYNGSLSAPTNAGTYIVTALVNDGVYQGGATNTFIINALPTITTAPLSQMPSYGAPAILNVAASGGGPYTYQWQWNGTNISGATDSSYHATQGGSYQVVVINPVGQVTSAPATVSFLEIAMCAMLTIEGPVGAQYRIDTLNTSNLTWSIYTNLTLPVSPYHYVDTNSPGLPFQFYRAVPLP